MKRRGRRRHGSARKESHTVCLEPDVAERLAERGRNTITGKPNLSAGIAIAEHATRGLELAGYNVPRLVDSVRKKDAWIVFELVDGPPDPPRAGETLDAWRNVP